MTVAITILGILAFLAATALWAHTRPLPPGYRIESRPISYSDWSGFKLIWQGECIYKSDPYASQGNQLRRVRATAFRHDRHRIDRIEDAR